MPLIILYNVWVLGHFTSRVYVTFHFWTPICNVLGYWRHRSDCYTSLFTTPLVVTTISVYNVLGPSDVVSRSGPGSSLDLLLDSSLVCVFDLSSVCVSSLCLSSLCVSSLLFSVPLSICLFISVSLLSLCLRPSHFATDGQSVSNFWCRTPSGAHDQIFITVWQLRSCFVGRPLWREDESTFCICCWPCQRSLSRVRVPWDSRPYFSVSDLRLLFSSPLTTRRVTVEVFDPASKGSLILSVRLSAAPQIQCLRPG
jgi:hypothetical protein